MQRIVISRAIGGFVLEHSLLRGLFAAHPQAFDEPLDPRDFALGPDATDEDVALRCMNAVLVEGGLRFLRHDDWVRALPWLADEVQRRAGRDCLWRGGSATIALVRPGLAWHVFEAEDGKEWIVEEPRVER